ncbi:MAG: hypothetical protein GX174_01125 [Lentisphaerae bacterium]|jgi:hypothetical protein|nr:hypothetical protein [Lentisphaerota bacterium]
MQLLLILGYLDPGTGSVIIQAVVGTLLGGLLIIKLYWRRIIAFLTGKKPPAKDARNAKDGNSPDK